MAAAPDASSNPADSGLSEPIETRVKRLVRRNRSELSVDTDTLAANSIARNRPERCSPRQTQTSA
eukprot:6195345-Pleurochrysis_carterae.AAC.4